MQLRFWRVEIAVLRLLLLSAKLSVGLSGAGLRNCQLEMETRLMWCNAYYSYIHNLLLSCLLSEDIIN